LAGALAFVPAALAATPTPLPSPPVAAAQSPRLTKQQAIQIFLRDDRVVDWLARYPPNPVTDATFKNGSWTVNVWSGAAGEIATGQVDDGSAAVTQAWVGPQVAWTMARGSPGAFGGMKINSYSVWLAFCVLFLVGLVDWRRPFSLRSLDLVVLLAFSVSLWSFNHGHVFASTVLAYPGLVWLLVRLVWIGGRNRPARGRAVWPVWLLVGAAIFAGGFRIGLNLRSSNVIDVGYAGVIGADRIVNGQSPYGHFPVEDSRPPCGPADANGEIRNRIQTNGRCESANPTGDTYGPVAYEAYIPGLLVLGWDGKWDAGSHGLPAVHATSILWDLICVLGLALVGRRFGGARLAATLALAWMAYPFTQYVSNSNTNDAIMPAFLIWGFYFLTSVRARGALLALSSWTKFGSLLLLPLWWGYPVARRLRPPPMQFVAAFLVVTVLAFIPLYFEPSFLHALHVFFDRTIKIQIDRHSPFSLWDWGQYHAHGLPDLRWLQHVLEGVLVLGVLLLAFRPRRRSPLQLAALTAAVLVGFEIVLTHWSYLYLPWFFPFAAFALLVDRDTHGVAAGRAPVAVALDEHPLDPDASARGFEPDGHPRHEAPDRALGDAADH
jgi:hypothetical protein